MPQKHLFIMDPLDKLNLTLDTTLRICRALRSQGVQTLMTTPWELSWQNYRREAQATVHELIIADDPRHGITAGKTLINQPLSSFSALHLRKDPPFDIDYVATTWIMDSVRGKCRLYNDPEALRSLNEKASLFMFPEASKDGLISSQPMDLMKYLENDCEGDAVLKPLTLFGGRDVIRLTLNDSPSHNKSIGETIEKATNGGKSLRIMQKFAKEVLDGEIRAFAVGGKSLAWCLKKPQAGNFLANTAAGATLHSYQPDQSLRTRVDEVARKLFEKGVAFVGLDLIGGFVSEINLTSPRLLHGPEDREDYYPQIADWIIKDTENFLNKEV